MENKDARDRRLIAYLLGQMSEAERTQLEDQYFAEDARFEYLAAVETDLIDSYVRGELAEPDRARFEQRFPRSPRLRARIALARQLQARARLAIGIPADEPARPQARSSRPATRATRSRPALIGAVSAVVVLIVAVVGWFAFQSTSSQAAPAGPNIPPPAAGQPGQPASPDPQPVSAATHHTSTPGPITLVLAPGSAGSRDDSALLTMPQGDDVVRIQIDHDGPARERYAVLVGTSDRQRVWTELDMTARAPGAKGVILEIPVSSLPAGHYILTLSGGAQGAKRLEALADYTFRVR